MSRREPIAGHASGHARGFARAAVLPLLALTWLAASGVGAATGSLLERAVVEGPLAPRDYWLFESGPVRPLALSHDGRRLYAANIPDGHLEIFAVTGIGLTHLGSVPVGLEPVALAVSPDDRRVWVVNHLSDSVSVVDVAGAVPNVEATLLVGDEPRDIVFAGPDRGRVFITTARRGQHHPLDALPTVPGLGRASVFVFAAPTGAAPAHGQPEAVLTLFGDTPRALAASPDGARVYAAVFRSGNRTTTLPPAAIRNFPKPPPNDSADGVPEPTTGVIVRQVGGNWVDELGRNYNGIVRLELPDLDVFEIDALAATPAAVRSHAQVGTILFDLAVNPQSGAVYVSNIESRNDTRFAGRSARASTTVRGRLADHRLSLIQGDEVSHRDLNPHLDPAAGQGEQADREASLSMPTGLAVSGDGERLYVAGYGSAKVAVYDTAALAQEGPAALPLAQLELGAGGPAGLVVDDARERLYVMTRFDNAVLALDPETGTRLDRVELFNPEPESVTSGRPFLYDARRTSGFGNDSCHSCHLFGDNDALAWDLGDPDGRVRDIPNAYHPLTAANPGLTRTFHPLKGPMTTQSMRGLPRHGPQHWRGDRTGIERAAGETLEEAAFKEFNEAFEALMALDGELSEADMQAFTDFAMQLTYPPNPIRALDNSLSERQRFGEELFVTGVRRGDGNLEVCVTCHRLNPANGIYGTTGTMAFNDQPGEKDFKIPHFRDQYQKVGMFTDNFGIPSAQVRGYAMNHNGATSINNLLAELQVPLNQTEALKDYLFAFPAETAPVTGQQVTVSAANFAAVEAQLALLLDQAAVTTPYPGCDLVVHSHDGRGALSWSHDRAAARFLSDRGGLGLDRAQLEQRLRGSARPHTLTCAPWGSGPRLGLDRDRDGVADATERRRGSHPADPGSRALRPAPGLWWNPARAGQGFDLQHAGGLLALTWYTYGEDGESTWYQAVADAGAEWQAKLLRFTWDPVTGTAVPEVVGTVAVRFEDALTGQLDWTIGENAGSQPIERFLFDTRVTALPFTGLWYDPAEPGWGLTVDSQGETRAAVLYFYGRDHRPRWVLFTQDNALEASAAAVSVTGPCPWCEFEPQQESPGGEVRLAFHDLLAGDGDIDVFSRDRELDGWRRADVALSRLTEVRILPGF